MKEKLGHIVVGKFTERNCLKVEYVCGRCGEYNVTSKRNLTRTDRKKYCHFCENEAPQPSKKSNSDLKSSSIPKVEQTRREQKIMNEDDYQNVCREKGLWVGKQLPVNTTTKTEWQCSQRHPIFSKKYNEVQQGWWCPTCSKLKRQKTPEELQRVCKDKGRWIGQNLPSTVLEKTKWTCSRCGHNCIFSFHQVQSGTWCPCIVYKSEFLARKCIEDYFGVPFPKKRPGWLQGLELDCYNEEKCIALEYNGRQHEQYIDVFYQSREEFEQRKQNDTLKKTLCEQQGVYLIVVPHDFTYLKPDVMKEFIFNTLDKKGMCRVVNHCLSQTQNDEHSNDHPETTIHIQNIPTSLFTTFTPTVVPEIVTLTQANNNTHSPLKTVCDEEESKRRQMNREEEQYLSLSNEEYQTRIQDKRKNHFIVSFQKIQEMFQEAKCSLLTTHDEYWTRISPHIYFRCGICQQEDYMTMNSIANRVYISPFRVSCQWCKFKEMKKRLLDTTGHTLLSYQSSRSCSYQCKNCGKIYHNKIFSRLVRGKGFCSECGTKNRTKK